MDDIFVLSGVLLVVAVTATLLVYRGSPVAVRARSRSDGGRDDRLAVPAQPDGVEASELHVNGGWR